jgi:hypothetical protein
MISALGYFSFLIIVLESMHHSIIHTMSHGGIYVEPLHLCSTTPAAGSRGGLSHNRGMGRSNVGGEILDLILS